LSQQSRVLVVAGLIVGLMVAALGIEEPATRADASTAAPATELSAWVARPRTMLRVESATTAGSVTLRALRPGRGGAWRRNRTSIAGPAGAPLVARAAVRGSLTGQRVVLVVVEYSSGREVQRRRDIVRVRAGQQVVARVPFRRQRAESRFAVGVVVPLLHPGQRIFATGVALRRRTSGRIPLSNGCSAGRRGVPSCGAYVGAAHGANTDPVDLEAATGGRLGIRRTYWAASEVRSAVACARRDLARGRLPWMSFKLPRSWADMAAGRGDAWARDLANRLDALPGPVWIAFHHEPEGEGDITTWRRIQERLAPLVHRAADNVAFTVVLTGWNQLYGATENRFANIWPRGVKIDVAGFDIYNQYGVVKDGAMNTVGTDLRSAYFVPISAWAKRHDVHWGLAETAYTDAMAERDPDWIGRTRSELAALGGIAFSYFDTTLHSAASWALSTTTKKQAFARARVGSPLLPLLR